MADNDAYLVATNIEDNFGIFFGADKARIVNDALGALRVKLGEDRGLVKGGWEPLWVVDFPMFEWDSQAQRWVALHHPFTAPMESDIDKLESNPLARVVGRKRLAFDEFLRIQMALKARGFDEYESQVGVSNSLPALQRFAIE